MSEREILLADSDSKARKRLANSFAAAGYNVETTDSTAHLFCSVLEKQIPVVLLGSGCDKKIALANLVPMLKRCNKGVTIIVVSDEESLPVIRSVRQEGIFYHALRPTGRDDTEDILKAVECAFNKNDRSDRRENIRHAAQQEAPQAAAVSCTVPLTAEMASEESTEAMNPVPAPERQPELMNTWQASEELPALIHTDSVQISQKLENTLRANTAALLTALTAAAAVIAYCVIAVTTGVKGSVDLMVGAFLGFCALIAVGQLLPAFFSARAAKKLLEQQLQDEGAARGEKQQAYSRLDNN